MIKAIVFDLGGVFFAEAAGAVSEQASKELGFNIETYRELSKENKQGLLTGKVRFVDVLKELKEKEHIKVSLKKMCEVWERVYFEARKENKELFWLVKELKKDYVVAMLSNIYDFSAETHRKRNHFDLFEPCILSSEVGLMKPGQEIFGVVIKKIGINPSECVFVDDVEDNCLAAQKAGFHAILFVNNKKLVADLKLLGVEIK